MRIGVWLLVIAAVVAACAALWHVRPRQVSFYTDADSIRTPSAHAQPRDVLWLPPEMLPALVNTAADEYEPKLSADGMTLFFVRGRAGENADIYTATRTADGWSHPSPLVIANSDADELGPEPSADGNTLYFYSDRAGGYGAYDVWVARRVDGVWEAPINLGEQINTSYNEYGAAVTPEGTALYFASNRPRAAGAEPEDPDAWSATVREDLYQQDYDLYVSALTERGVGPARPVVELNTPYNDGSPDVSPVGDFVYFSSDRPGGEGGFDIYRARRLNGGHLAPESVGSEVNTAANELDPALGMDGFSLHFSSDRRVAGKADDPLADRPDYDLYMSRSREVFRDWEVRRASIDWPAVLPYLFWIAMALLALLLLLLLRRFMGSERFGKLSLLAKCLLLSAFAHMLLMMLFAAWGVGFSLGEWARKSSGVQVALTSPSVGQGLAAQIRGGFTEVALETETPELTPMEQAVERVMPEPLRATMATEAIHIELTDPLVRMTRASESSERVQDRREPTPESPDELERSLALTAPVPSPRSEQSESAVAVETPPLTQTSEANDSPLAAAPPLVAMSEMAPVSLASESLADADRSWQQDSASRDAQSVALRQRPPQPVEAIASGDRIDPAKPTDTVAMSSMAERSLAVEAEAPDRSGPARPELMRRAAPQSQPAETLDPLTLPIAASDTSMAETSDPAASAAPLAPISRQRIPDPGRLDEHATLSIDTALDSDARRSTAERVSAVEASIPSEAVRVAESSTPRPRVADVMTEMPALDLTLPEVTTSLAEQDVSEDAETSVAVTRPVPAPTSIEVPDEAVLLGLALPEDADGDERPTEEMRLALPVISVDALTPSNAALVRRDATQGEIERPDLLPISSQPIEISALREPAHVDDASTAVRERPRHDDVTPRRTLAALVLEVNEPGASDVEPAAEEVDAEVIAPRARPLRRVDASLTAIPSQDSARKRTIDVQPGELSMEAPALSLLPPHRAVEAVPPLQQRSRLALAAPNQRTAVNLALPMETDVEALLPRGAIHGIVLDTESGDPLRNATVRLDVAEGDPIIAQTGPDGAYQIVLPRGPEFVAVSAACEGYTPQSVNISSEAVRHKTVRHDFALEAERDEIVVIELEPEVHHLGDDDYSGRINSRFQKRSEGRSYRATFVLTDAQVPDTDRLVMISLMARGVELRNEVRINGRQLTQSLSDSPSDGRFGTWRAYFPASRLRAGRNSLEIRSVYRGSDLDDFEFVNIQIDLHAEEQPTPRPASRLRSWDA
jgi:hypothetical protein